MSLLPAKQAVVIIVVVIGAAAIVGLGLLGHSASNEKTLGEHVKADSITKTTPAAPSIKAFDSANAVDDPGWFAQAYAAGFRLYIINTTLWDGTCNPWPQAQAQIGNALAAGLKVAAYTRNPDCWQNGILATGTYQSQLQFFALDIETDPGVPATRAMVDGVKSMNIRPIIYTGSRMWPMIQGSSSRSFSDLPLWETNPLGLDYASWQANYLSPKPVKFGGWNTATNMRTAVQQQLEYTLNGVNVDLDSFNTTFLQ